MSEIVQETATDRGHRSVEKVVTGSDAIPAINDEISKNPGDTKGNKEFLQAASADLLTKGLLPEMAVDFGKKHFKELDTDKDGNLSEGEVRRALQKGQDNFSPAERLAGNYLADKIADPKSGLTYTGYGKTSESQLDQYKEKTATKYGEYRGGQEALKAFGNDKDYAGLDTDKDGQISEKEMKEKLAYNDRRLGEDDIGQKTKEKFEKENKALDFMTKHFKEMSVGNGNVWDNNLTQASMRQYAVGKQNPGAQEGQYRVTDDMVRGSSEAEAKAVADAKVKADGGVKAKADAEVKAKADADAQAKADADAQKKADAATAEGFMKKWGLIKEDAQVCLPGDPNCHVGPKDESDPKIDKPKAEVPEQEAPKLEKDQKEKQEKAQEKLDKQEPEKQEKPLTELEKLATKAGASTLDNVGKAYEDAAKNGKGVAIMIVGENTPGSKELLEKLPELQNKNPNLNFVVIDKDRVNKSADPALAAWKSWVGKNQSSNEAFTSVQSLKLDSKGNAMPDKVTSTHWGAKIEEGLKDQARYAAGGTRRNLNRPPSETNNTVKVPEAPAPDEQLKKVESTKNNNDKPSDRRNDRPREVQYARTQADLDAAIKANTELGLPTIIDVTRSNGCGNCDSQNPVMDRLAKDHPGQIIKIDADSQLGRSHSIPRSTLPNIFVQSKDGQKTAYQGFQQEDVLRRALSTTN
ncbi:hypothetical protein BH10CYA1_BH10CYA1_11240 [soil metagenome]